MKRLIIITLSVIALLGAINFTVVYARTDAPLPSGNRTYVLREHDGVVACYEEQADEPFLITDVKVIDLPPKDRSMLADGVVVVGSRALSRALEDYRP